MHSRQAILSLIAAPRDAVPVQTRAGTAYLLPFTAADRDGFEQDYTDDRERGLSPNFRAYLLQACLCDEKGTLLFPDKEEGREALSKLPADVAEPLCERASALAGMRKADREALEKNSGTGDGGGSGGSPAPTASPARDSSSRS